MGSRVHARQQADYILGLIANLGKKKGATEAAPLKKSVFIRANPWQ
jgi:hypothetical protein